MQDRTRSNRDSSAEPDAGSQQTGAAGKGNAASRRYAGVAPPVQASRDPSVQKESQATADADGNANESAGAQPATGRDGADPKPDQDTAKGARRAGAPRTKSQALARHRKNQRLMKKIISSGLALTPDPTQGAKSRMNLFENSADWIDKGQAKMFVLSPTHDSHKRDSVPPSETAYFDTRVDYQGAGGTYDATLTGGKATNDAGI